MVLTRVGDGPKRPQILLGTFCHSVSRTELDILHDAAVAVDEAGKIVAVVKGAGSIAAAKAQALKETGWAEGDVSVSEAKRGQFFFPGFIDTHVHASQYPNVGLFGKTTLLDWLNKYTFPTEASLKDPARARRVYTACVRRTLAHGTTTATYYASIDAAATRTLAELCLSLGQRAFVGRVCMDRADLCPDYYRDESAEESLRLTKQSIEDIRAIDPNFALVSPILTPRFAPACSPDAMNGLSRLQKDQDLPLQTHISENINEISLVRSMYPDSGSYANVYEQHGLLTDRTVLGHAVHITEGEAGLIAHRGSKIAHCPCSNASLTSGEARVRWLWSHGIDVGLGTDMSGGYSPSILEAARQAALTSRHLAAREDDCGQGENANSAKLSVEEVLYLSTRGGAKCLGIADRVGGFDVGLQLDAQLIGLAAVQDDGLRDGESDEEFDAGNVDVFGWESWEDMIAKWLYNGDDRNTKKVWVKGRVVHARR